MKEKKPVYDRYMLQRYNAEKYVNLLECIVIEQGKKVLNGIRVRYIIVHSEQITNFIKKYPEFEKGWWRQIGIYRLFQHRKISRKDYKLLIAMKQALNKNDNYILRHDEFQNRKDVLECSNYKTGTKHCVNDHCGLELVCPVHYRNEKLNKKVPFKHQQGTRKEKDHLRHCKHDHYWTAPVPSIAMDHELPQFLVCKNTGEFIDTHAVCRAVLQIKGSK